MDAAKHAEKRASGQLGWGQGPSGGGYPWRVASNPCHSRIGQDTLGQTVTLAYGDQGDTGDRPKQAAAEQGIDLAVVRLPETKRGFVLLSRRWAVEWDFAWMSRFRRLARGQELLADVLKGFHLIAFIMRSPRPRRAFGAQKCITPLDAPFAIPNRHARQFRSSGPDTMVRGADNLAELDLFLAAKCQPQDRKEDGEKDATNGNCHPRMVLR